MGLLKMKYCVLIIDGASGLPLPERGSKTCLELAHTPNLDAMAQEGALGLVRTVPAGMELDHGAPLAGRQFDTSYKGMQTEADGLYHTWLRDPKSGRTVTQLFDQSFTQCIVYTPPHREAICLEPYTCVPDSFRLAAEGHETGLRILKPGESFETKIPISVT